MTPTKMTGTSGLAGRINELIRMNRRNVVGQAPGVLVHVSPRGTLIKAKPVRVAVQTKGASGWL